MLLVPSRFAPFPYTTLFRSASCESLAALALPSANITSVQAVAAGGFTPPGGRGAPPAAASLPAFCRVAATLKPSKDRKSTRLNSSHLGISYAVFCLKKKKRH